MLELVVLVLELEPSSTMFFLIILEPRSFKIASASDLLQIKK